MKSFTALLILVCFVFAVTGCETVDETNRLYDDQWKRARDEVRSFERPIVYPLKIVADVILYPVLIGGKLVTDLLTTGLDTAGEKGYL